MFSSQRCSLSPLVLGLLDRVQVNTWADRGGQAGERELVCYKAYALKSPGHDTKTGKREASTCDKALAIHQRRFDQCKINYHWNGHFTSSVQLGIKKSHLFVKSVANRLACACKHSWLPNSTDLGFWYLFVQQTNIEDVTGYTLHRVHSWQWFQIIPTKKPLDFKLIVQLEIPNSEILLAVSLKRFRRVKSCGNMMKLDLTKVENWSLLRDGKSFGPFWAILGLFGPFWAILNNFWSILDNFGSFLGYFGSFSGHFLC